MTPFKIERLGLVMEPKAGEPSEVEGVLNPAAARGRDGELYLFPRLVGKGNFSRIGIARVLFDKAGDPTGVERMGFALEPEADYELRPGGGGGCEDPRISFIDTLDHYVMTYTAFSPRGPRIAIARSDDLLTWERVGLAKMHPYKDISFDGVDNKDASVFPTLVPDPHGEPSIAMLHRPLFPRTRPEEKVEPSIPEPDSDDLESIWISYWHMTDDGRLPRGSQFVAPAAREAGGALGGAEDRRRGAAGALPTRLAVHLPWRPRAARLDPGASQSGLFGRGDGAGGRPPSSHPLSLAGAVAGAGHQAGTGGGGERRRLPDRHRPPRRSWRSRPLRHLLRHG